MSNKNYFGFIYEWTDSTNGKNYIGSHRGLTEDDYDGSGILFQRVFKIRPESFTREILEYVYEDSKKVLLEVEQKYLNQINWDNTYNLVPTAGGGSVKGRIVTEDAKQKQSESMKEYWKGASERKQSEEEKQKRSETLKGNVNGRGNKGRKLSEEHKKNIGLGNKGKIHSEEQNQKQSERMKGNTIGCGNKENSWSLKRRAAYERRNDE